jgi:hypothetical protein
MPLISNAYNLNTGNKWMLILPYKKIDSEITTDNIAMNLTNFTLPDLEIGSVDFDIRGRAIPIPTHVQNEDKTLTFNYMLSSDWHQYKFLWKWFNQISDENNGASDSYGNLVVDISILLISEYKKALFTMNFRGCWINSLQSLDLNYQSGEENIQHSFTVKYATFDFEGLI